MINRYQLDEIVKEAEREINQANDTTRRCASICSDRLKSSGVYHGDLCKLKRELANYNMHTREWRS